MIRPGFLNSSQRSELEEIVRHPREEHGVARRANAILLLDDGMSCVQVGKVLYLDDDTVRSWYKEYMSGGVDGLLTFDWKGGLSRLSASQEEDLMSWLEGHICRDTNEIRLYILKKWGVAYSRSGCIKLMHRLGFIYQKPKSLPAISDEQAQQSYIDSYEKLQKFLPEDEAIYFVDAVHPQYQSRPAHGWIRKGSKVALKRNSGRKRMNIHGALCLEDFDAPFVEVTTVNEDSTIALFERIEASAKNKKKIHLILDNATYHKSQKVQQWLARPECRIQIIWLPSYCPHLNPIERLWKVMHEYVTNNKFYKTLKEFANTILHFLRETIPKEWKNFRDQVTDNFRIISHQDFRVLE